MQDLKTPVSDVLIVDDDDGVRRLVSTVLSEHGFEVRTSANGRVALDACLHDPPRLIVLDLEMPVMDGRTFARELSTSTQFDQVPPIIVLSAYGARRAAREIGAAGWMQKPFDEQRLVDMIEATLGDAA